MPRLGCVVLLTLLAAVPPAHAQQGERVLAEGVSLFDSGEYERSLQVLRRALPELRGDRDLARVHLYLGLSQAFLGRTRPARAAFAAALSHDPAIRLDPERIKPSVVRLFEQVREGMQGQLVVETDAPGAVVRVDGAEAGAAPVRLRVAPGRHLVQVVSADGLRVFKRQVQVSAGRDTLVRAELGPSTPGEPRPPKVEEPKRGELPPRARKRLWTWVVGGAGLGLMAIGGGIWGWAQSSFNAADAEVNDPSKLSLYEQGAPSGPYDTLVSTYRNKFIAGQVVFGIGAAALATAVVLFFVEGHRAEAAAAPARGVTFAPSPGGAVLSGSF
jgi:hypothetical protein